MKTHKSLRRAVSILVIFAMLLAAMPAVFAEGEGTTVYLKPNDNWKQGNARFAVYYFSDSENGWVGMEAADVTGYYQATVPAGYSSLIFCRMDPDKTENGWDSKWNQTNDLTVPTGEYNCYTVADGTWNKGAGSWGVKPAATDPLYYLMGGPKDDWKNGLSMTKGEDGKYTVTIRGVAARDEAYEYKVKEVGSGDPVWHGDAQGQNCKLSLTEESHVTFIFDPTTEEVTATPEPIAYYIAGDLPGIAWDPAQNPMTKNEESGLWEITFNNVPAKKHEFKITDGTWDNAWGDNGGNCVVNPTAISNVTITFDADQKKIAVETEPVPTNPDGGEPTQPEQTTVEYYLVGNINGADHGFGLDSNNLGNYQFVDDELTATFTQDSYVLVKTGDNANWYLAETYCQDARVTLETGKGYSEKMLVPGNVEVKFKLTVNDDGTLTLSYTKVENPDGGDPSQPGESKPGESQPGESQPGESKPGESQPGESQPGESQPGESQPGESKPGESQPGESKPGESQPGESQPGESQPGESQPGESQPGESQPGESQPGESKPGESQPGESQPGESQPDETQPDNTVYHVAGSENMCGDDWNPAGNPMTKGENGLHTITFTEVPAGKVEFKITDGTWDNSWGNNGSNYRLDLDAKSNVTIIFDPVKKVATWDLEALEEAKPTEAPTYFTVAGNKELCGAGWDPAQNPMTKGEDGLYTITFAGVPAGKHEFKVTVGSWDDSWGKDGGSNNEVLELTAKSDVTITFDAVSKKITVTTKALEQPAETTKPTETTQGSGTTPEQPKPEDPSQPETYDYTVAGTKKLCGAEWDPSKNPMAPGGDGKYSITFQAVPAGKHEFKVTDGTWVNSWGDNGGNYVLNLTAISNVTITFDPATKEITVSTLKVEGVETPEYDVTIHFLPEEGWGSTINGYVWDETGEITGTWPGTAITANAEHAGWYDLKVTTVMAEGFKFIFNDGSKQTIDLSTGALTGDLELWYMGQTRYTVAPEAWSGIPTFTYTIHFQNADGWKSVNAYAWLEGDKLLGEWPGTAIRENRGNPGWYDVTLTVPSDTMQVIFSDGEGKQTKDITVTAPSEERTVELWIQAEAPVFTEPENWVQVAPGYTVKLHFMNPFESWGSDINAWIWVGAGDVPGYEDYHISWPGKRVDADPENPGWYYLEVTTDLPEFKFIFNGNGRQTKDLSTGEITDDMELWVYGDDIYTTMPTTTPQTGDSTNVTMYVCLLALSLLALAAVITLKKRAIN